MFVLYFLSVCNALWHDRWGEHAQFVPRCLQPGLGHEQDFCMEPPHPGFNALISFLIMIRRRKRWRCHSLKVQPNLAAGIIATWIHWCSLAVSRQISEQVFAACWPRALQTIKSAWELHRPAQAFQGGFCCCLRGWVNQSNTSVARRDLPKGKKMLLETSGFSLHWIDLGEKLEALYRSLSLISHCLVPPDAGVSHLQ